MQSRDRSSDMHPNEDWRSTYRLPRAYPAGAALPPMGSNYRAFLPGTVPQRMNRLPLDHVDRICQHDHKLWLREKAIGEDAKDRMIYCPCRECYGGTVKRKVENVTRHLRKHGRCPIARYPRRGEVVDSSDEEWIESFSTHGIGENSARYGVDGAQEARPVPVQSHYTVNPLGLDVDMDINQSHYTVNPPGLDADMDINRMINEAYINLDDITDEDFTEPRNFPDNPDSSMAYERFEMGEMEGEALDLSEPDEPENADLKLLQEACKPLFKECKSSILAFVMMFLNICSNHSVPNKFVDEMLCLLRKHILPEDNETPKSMYAAKRLIRKLGLNYIAIDACPHGCFLFRGEFKDPRNDKCPECGADRFKDMVKKKRPVKVLRWLPLMPRLLRMYKCSTIAELMQWTPNNQSTDGLIRHTGDCKAWKHIDTLYPEFAAEPRNLRFGLALDGVNPYGEQSTSWSTWPVMLLNYNLAPWLTTKRFFVMLSLIIPGRESVTINNIDVFLAPMVDEAKEMWAGIDCYDASALVGKRKFKLRSMILWTINDYPAFGLVAGQCHQGFLGCVICGYNVVSVWSYPCQKPIFLGHRRWLESGHAYRKRRLAKHFNDGKAETRMAPPRASASDILKWAAEKVEYDENGGAPDGVNDPYKKWGVKRRSILFDLPYWEHLLIRHTLDLMHAEKNLAENTIKYLLGAKDTDRVRADLKERGLRPELWCRFDKHPTKPGKTVFVKPAAPYVLSPKEKLIFISRLENLKLPSNYGGALKTHVVWKDNKVKLLGMKSHDYHIMMQQILPVCLRGLLEKPVRQTLIGLCRIFKQLCAKVLDPKTFPTLKQEVAVTLVRLEMYFPLAYFDVMTHLLVHLVEEAEICGTISNRWMYPMERYMGLLKRYVRTKVHPEASMAEGYILDEGLGFITEYMQRFEPVRCRVWDHEEEKGVVGEFLEGAGSPYVLSREERDLAHVYVLLNHGKIMPWLSKYEDQKQLDDTIPPFSTWIQNIIQEQLDQDIEVDRDVFWLSVPPKRRAQAFSRMQAYGNHFRVFDSKAAVLTTYDSGIAVVGNNNVDSGSSIEYVGELSQILLLDYGSVSEPVILMKAKWVSNVGTAMKRDRDGFLIANFRMPLPTNEDPYIFPSQVEQVFYLNVEGAPGWRVVLHKEARSRRIAQEQVEVRIEDTGLSNLDEHGPMEPVTLESSLADATILSTAAEASATDDYSEQQIPANFEDWAPLNSDEEDESQREE